MNPKQWDSNFNFQVSDGCCLLGPRDGPVAVVVQEHEVFEDVFASVQSP